VNELNKSFLRGQVVSMEEAGILETNNKEFCYALSKIKTIQVYKMEEING